MGANTQWWWITNGWSHRLRWESKTDSFCALGSSQTMEKKRIIERHSVRRVLGNAWIWYAKFRYGLHCTRIWFSDSMHALASRLDVERWEMGWEPVAKSNTCETTRRPSKLRLCRLLFIKIKLWGNSSVPPQRVSDIDESCNGSNVLGFPWWGDKEVLWIVSLITFDQFVDSLTDILRCPSWESNCL